MSDGKTMREKRAMRFLPGLFTKESMNGMEKRSIASILKILKIFFASKLIFKNWRNLLRTAK